MPAKDQVVEFSEFDLDRAVATIEDIRRYNLQRFEMEQLTAIVFEDERTGRLHATNVACRLLDRTSCRCSNYKLRRVFVPDCVRLDAANMREIDWLPRTCAYRLRGDGEPLKEWHYLISGDRETVHEAGISVRGWTISEDDAGDLDHHLVDRLL